MATASPASVASSSFGTAPTPITTRSAAKTRPSRHATRSTAARPSSAATSAPVSIPTPRSACSRGEEAGDRRRHHPVHDPLQGLEHDHLGAELGEARGDLEADVAAADDHRPGARPDRRPDALGIGERPQVEDPFEMLARQPEAPSPGAGAQHEGIVGQLLVVQDDRAPVPQNPERTGRETEIDPALGIVRGGADQGPLERHLAAHVGLGQGRPLIGRRRLVADHHDLAANPSWRRLIATWAPAWPAPMMTTRSVIADLWHGAARPATGAVDELSSSSPERFDFAMRTSVCALRPQACRVDHPPPVTRPPAGQASCEVRDERALRPCDLPAIELRLRIGARQISPVELQASCRTRIDPRGRRRCRRQDQHPRVRRRRQHDQCGLWRPATRSVPGSLRRLLGRLGGGAGCRHGAARHRLGHGRLPAQLRACGMAGFRPSPGTVPHELRPIGWSPLRVQGEMGRTVADTALLHEVMAGTDLRDPLS